MGVGAAGRLARVRVPQVEIAELRDELAALEMNQKNRRAAVGPAQSDGEPTGADPVTLALLGK